MARPFRRNYDRTVVLCMQGCRSSSGIVAFFWARKSPIPAREGRSKLSNGGFDFLMEGRRFSERWETLDELRLANALLSRVFSLGVSQGFLELQDKLAEDDVLPGLVVALKAREFMPYARQPLAPGTGHDPRGRLDLWDLLGQSQAQGLRCRDSRNHGAVGFHSLHDDPMNSVRVEMEPVVGQLVTDIQHNEEEAGNPHRQA